MGAADVNPADGWCRTTARERQITFVFSTHDPRVMARARRIVRLVDGRVDSDEARSPEAEGREA